MEKNAVKEAIQVCLTVDDENFDWEYEGLLAAMRSLGLKEGSIVTLHQRDLFEKDGMVVRMIPAEEFMKGN
jgi:hypothetical protein